MRYLCDVYESARRNIPLRHFPERESLQSWDGLYDVVRSELEALHAKTLAVVADDRGLLANHHRVLREFNQGVRDGYFADVDTGQVPAAVDPDSFGPFYWGVAVGRRAKGRFGGDPQVLKQFLTASHLLEYEFSQLDEAYKRPFDFMLRNLGPEHRDELRELAFSLPLLLNYLRPLVQRLIDERTFDFYANHAALPAAPTHLEYLAHLVAALFDPEPLSWVRVAVFARLASVPFKDGQSLQSENALAPEQAVAEIARTPIAARTLVRRQVERVELANSWIGAMDHTIDARLESARQATLWDVYLLSEASRILGGDDNFGDLLAGTVILSLSEQIEAEMPPEKTRLDFLRHCYAAFLRGFDARHECVVDSRALAWVARGRAMSDGLRRFPDGGYYIAGVAVRLAQLAATTNELRYGLDNPVDFVFSRLKKTRESSVAERLLEILETNQGLATDLFSTNAAFQFSSRTKIQTYDAHDLLRSALFHIAQGARPDFEDEGERAGLIAKGRKFLQELIATGDLHRDEGNGRNPSPAVARNREALEAGKLFAANFDTLVRVVESALRPLYLARMLDTSQFELLHGKTERFIDPVRSAGL